MKLRQNTPLSAIAIAAAAVIAATAPASAQREQSRGNADRNIAGQFDYYTLALSWSPTYCSSSAGERSDLQCNARDGRRYAFVLHGLWPQYDRGWPEFCRIRQRPYVPQPLIDRMLDIMPSPKLVIHEFRKHGTCSGLNPDQYFTLSRRLFERIAIPKRYVNPFETQFVSPEELSDELVALNPGLRPDMLAIECDGPGNRLREVRVCFDREGAYRSCGRNEDQRKLCSAARMFVPPVRSSRGPEDASRDRRAPERNDSPLPGPRIIESPRSL